MIISVKKGENIASLAARYHTTVDRIAELNALEDAALYAGQRLWVEGYLMHTWAPYDTVENVSARYAVRKEDVGEGGAPPRVGERVRIRIR
ncbi:MAG: LysM peptidoglycan-binding domain-containing protein [Clostridia bacterium]|nr:LysM peptidoglycan-binding domain-containing protein [Clostridia bacterium]